MPSYQAREAIYLCSKGRLVQPGEIFSSDEPPGLAWIVLETRPPAPPTPTRRIAAGPRK
jgi:hypothetical protein